MVNNHPPCPKCASPMNSNGAIRWICTNCGFSPLKHHRERERPDYSKRTSCPKCGAYYGMKLDSQRYQCGRCGTRYQRDWQDKIVYQQTLNEIKMDAPFDKAITE